jgi:small nuclear ribonucleoprotein B and B'
MDLLPALKTELQVRMADGRVLTGKLLAFDAHSNLLLGRCTERRDAAVKRYLGLVLVRGEHVMAVATPKTTAFETQASSVNQ